MKYNGMIIFGEMGSGKDTLADLIIESDPDFSKYGLGDIIRVLKKVSLVDPNWIGDQRTFMQTTADKLREIDVDLLNHYALADMLMEHLGDFALTKENYREDLNTLFTRVREEAHVIPLIVGGRTWMDLAYWTKRGFLSVGILVDNDIRLDRLVDRDGRQIASRSNAAHNTEKDVGDIIKECEIKVDNNGGIDELRGEARRLAEFFNSAN